MKNNITLREKTIEIACITLLRYWETGIIEFKYQNFPNIYAETIRKCLDDININDYIHKK
jgi:hypothetical protein